MTGSESATFISKDTAIEYGKGNMIRFKVTGPYIDDFDKSNPVKYYVVGGTSKHHTAKEYFSAGPMFRGHLKRIKEC